MHKLNSNFIVSIYPQSSKEGTKQFTELQNEGVNTVILCILNNELAGWEEAWIAQLNHLGQRNLELITISMDAGELTNIPYLKEINRLILNPLTHQKKVAFYGRNWDLSLLIGLTCLTHFREGSEERFPSSLSKNESQIQSLVREYSKKCFYLHRSTKSSSRDRTERFLKKCRSLPEFITSIKA